MCRAKEDYRHAMRMMALPSDQVEVNYGRVRGSDMHWTPPAGDLGDLPLNYINDPDFVRERKVEKKPTPWDAKHVLGWMRFRHEGWPADHWCLPSSVDGLGVWLHLFDGKLRIVPWDQLASEWLWNSQGEPQWRRCIRENAPGASADV